MKNKTYCTYVRFRGFFYVLGWFLVGMYNKPLLSGYANDFACHGNCYIILLEVDDKPIRERFWFIPSTYKKLAKYIA